MKRSEFFAEMGKGFFKTVKEVTSPFISEDIEKLDSFTDDLAGLKWYEIGGIDVLAQEGFRDFFIAGNSIAVIFDKKGFKAFKQFCPTCKTVPQWITYERKFKCLICENEYFVENDSGELQLKQYPLNLSEEKLYLGIY